MGFLDFCSPGCGLVIMLMSLFVWCNHWVTSYEWEEKKMLNDFLIREWTWILHVIRTYLIHELYFIYVVEAFIILNWKTLYKYISPFSRLLLLCIHLYVFINLFIYTNGKAYLGSMTPPPYFPLFGDWYCGSERSTLIVLGICQKPWEKLTNETWVSHL